MALHNLGRYEEANQSYQRAIGINPNEANAIYNLACLAARQGNIEQTLNNLAKAIKLDRKYQALAKTESDFDRIRGDKRFQALLKKASESPSIKSFDRSPANSGDD